VPSPSSRQVFKRPDHDRAGVEVDQDAGTELVAKANYDLSPITQQSSWSGTSDAMSDGNDRHRMGRFHDHRIWVLFVPRGATGELVVERPAVVFQRRAKRPVDATDA